MDEKPKTKAALRNEEMWRKHHVDCRELKRIHDLKPAQERFMIAITRNQFGNVEEFLKSGEIDVNHIECGKPGQSGGHTPLGRATQTGSADMVQLILEYGGDVRSTSPGKNDTASFSPLGHALRRMGYRGMALKQVEVERTVRALLLHGADVNASGYRGETPLQSAVVHGRTSVLVKLLLDHGADISKTDQRGYNALHSLSDREGAVSVRNKMCKTMLDHVQHDFQKMMDITGEMVYINFDPDHDPDASDSDSDGEGDNYHDPGELAEILERPGLGEMILAARMAAYRQQTEWINTKTARDKAEKSEDARQRKAAVAMSLHSRLGANSGISTLGNDIMGIIAKNM
jgi:ankyrin repeat protein